jgi:hypothetical protein
MFLKTEERRSGTEDTSAQSSVLRPPSLHPYFPAPFGDMMITGCFGLLSAVGDVLPELADPIRASLSQTGRRGVAPWDVA